MHIKTPNGANSLTPQALVILRHLQKTGSITGREALLDHGVVSCTRRITELRDAGYEIDSKSKVNPNNHQRYVRYVLAPKHRLAA